MTDTAHTVRTVVVVLVLGTVVATAHLAGATATTSTPGPIGIGDSVVTAGTAEDASNVSGTAGSKPWQLTHHVDVTKNGTVTVTASVNRSVGRLQINGRETGAMTFTAGGASVTRTDTRLQKYWWETGTNRSVTYQFTLGHSFGGSGSDTGIITFRVWEIGPVTHWSSQVPDPRWRFVIEGPSGWRPIMDGKRIGRNTYVMPSDERTGFPKDFIAIGDFTVHQWRVAGEKYRLAKAPTAKGPSISRIKELVNRTAPIVRSFMGSNDTRPKALIVATSAIESGGVAKHHTAVFGDGSPLFTETGKSVYVHEITHLYQEWGETYKTGIGDWSKEGSAMYLQHYSLWKGGYVNQSTFERMVRIDTTTDGDEVGQPVNATAEASPYVKGEAVWAALDMDVRARTDGRRTLADVFERLNSQIESSKQGKAIAKSEFLTALEEVTGTSYERFYRNYVAGDAYPRVLLSANYSLTNPVSVNHGLPSRAALLERIDEMRETIRNLREKLNSTRIDIDVTVSTANGSRFVVGGEMVVTANASETNEAIRVRYANRTRKLGADQRATFNLSRPGTRAVEVAYNGSVESTNITVRSSNRTNPFPNGVPGVGDRPPTDPDDDGKFEDVNGDGTATFKDAVALAFANLSKPSSKEVRALDFNSDGTVGFEDAVVLAFQV